MIWVLFSMSSLWYTQARVTLQDVYAKIDSIVSTRPSKVPYIQQQIQILMAQQKDVAKRQLLDSISTYIQSRVGAQNTKKRFAIGSHIDQAPAWYKTLSMQQMMNLSGVVHVQWDDQWPIWVLEFIDFQCPFCQRQHNNRVLEKLTYEEYPWKVRSAAVMFPLTGKWHELATDAAESAECAYRQGGVEAFYAHKDGLYAAWLQPWPNTIARVAKNNWLDADALKACMDNGDASDAVQAQKNLWRRMWITWTPGTVVIDMRTWAYQVIKWAVPMERFMPVIERLYKSVQ